MLVSLAAGLAGCDEHGHGHGEHDQGGHGEGAEEDPRPVNSVTVYADGLELFMEWPAFVVGAPTPLVAHFTSTQPGGFAWVTSGQVTATLRYGDGVEEQFSVDHLLRSGIFKPVVTPTRAGRASLTLRLSGENAGTVAVGEVEVYASVDAAVAAAPPEEAGEPTVSYLKEAQWKTVYATEEVARRTLRGSVRAAGELSAPPGAYAAPGSPLAGRLVATDRLRVGAEVRAGEVLARVVGLGAEDRATVDMELAEAEAALARAEQAAARAEALSPAVVSVRQRDEARLALDLARRRLAAMRERGRAWAGGGSGGAAITAPISGRVAFVRAAHGSVVAAGAPIVEIVQPGELWLTARVFESDIPAVRGSSGAMFALPGAGAGAPVLIGVGGSGGLLAIGPVVDPVDRTVPVVFSFPNPGDLLPGTYVDAQVFTGEHRDVVAIPASALVDDGALIVYVMDGGESFYRRRVRVGVRDGGWVEILEGVSAGERVVSRGAYEVLLATSAGGIPEHGHQH